MKFLLKIPMWRLSLYSSAATFPAAMFWAIVLSLGLSSLSFSQTDKSPRNDWQFDLRYRLETKPNSGRFHTLTRQENWNPERTAVIVCDVWDAHHSINAVRRVEELAPRIDQFIKLARQANATVIHAPSDCMDSYLDHPARQRAIQVPAADNVPSNLLQWCHQIDAEKPFTYPIDQSDGGEDDDPIEHEAWAKQLEAQGRNPASPWKKQSHLITIDQQQDFISDSGPEIWSILESRQIDHVIICGVHTNMCVLGRPFGLRNMVTAGKQVTLVRDLTDTMYNPQRWPYVNHHTGTDLIVEYIEKCICPTITSDQLLGGQPFRFQSDTRPTLAIVMAEDEYETNLTLPKFAADFLGHSFRVAFVFSDENNLNDLPGLEILNTADVALLSIRRRPLPAKQMELFRKFADSGKPLVGIRTASHAFSLRTETTPNHLSAWPEFDNQVWGGNYSGHHGNNTLPKISVSSTNAEHPILSGIRLEPFPSSGSLYKTNPLAANTQVLLTGAIPSHPPEPVAWTFERPNGGLSFYTSLGHKDDFQNEAFQRLLFNGLVWASGLDQAEFRKAESTEGKEVGKKEDTPALRKSGNVPALQVAEGLELDLLLQEPQVSNPLYLNFDHRGRLWVVQYRQYPWPAGLKLLSRDNVWRNVYQPAFPPPPPHANDSPFRGRDQITIHEDTNGDGVFDQQKVFLDGLNLATAALPGRGGVFIMNPPYLLFYADHDHDDVPDSPQPKILLSGFGIEDTHSIGNSLRWGPDGWIYGTQGSTVSAAVVRHDPREPHGQPLPGESPIHSMGQNIWRYHPERHQYEIFAEGGGNAFGVEFDSVGRVYSGHNGGDTRGFHYVQGGYYSKSFGKHGLHSNPFTFAYYGAMRHHAVERFTHTFKIYDADTLPPFYHGKLISISPVLHNVMLSDIFPDGSTRMTNDIAPIVAAGSQERDNWFTPVDIQIGPDGALYLADWYSMQSNHYRNHEGQTNPDLGRVYRLRDATQQGYPIFDLSTYSSRELVEKGLRHPNRWYRETALRLLGDRKDQAVVPVLKTMASADHEPHALEALWALHQSDGLDDAIAVQLLAHPQPAVRAWTIRLLADRGDLTDSLAQRFVRLAELESDVEVRLQLACSCRRLPTPLGLELLGKLLRHDEDAQDPLMPNAIWWGVESHASNHAAILSWLQQSDPWHSSLAETARVTSNLMRRWAILGTREDLMMCAELLRLSPDATQSTRLMEGFTRAFEGRAIPQLPTELVDQLSRVEGRFSTLLGIRRGEAAAIQTALSRILDVAVSEDERSQLIRALGEVQAEQAVPVFLRLLQDESSDGIATASMAALQGFEQAEIGATILAQFSRMSPSEQETAQSVLASRQSWSLQLIQAIDAGNVDPKRINQDTVTRLAWHRDPELQASVGRLFPKSPDDTHQLDQRIELVEKIVLSGNGNPLQGQRVFHEAGTCGKCHQMFGRGGAIGPDLTSYNRSNLRTMLLGIINPDAEIREGFENLTILTDDGLVVTGFKVDEDANTLVLRSVDGQSRTVEKSGIEEFHQNRTSLMPTGLLDGLSDSELRDLFAFLTSTTPPN